MSRKPFEPLSSDWAECGNPCDILSAANAAIAQDAACSDQVVERLMAALNSAANERDALREKLKTSYVPQELASEWLALLEETLKPIPGQPNTIDAMLRRVVAEHQAMLYDHGIND